jgi:hypothetical protein
VNHGLLHFSGSYRPGGLPWRRLIHMAGPLAARPAAHPFNAGMFYLATDGGGAALARSDGATWASCSVTSQAGTAALDAAFAITAANGVYQAVRTTTPAADLAVALPAAGTYLLTMVILAGLNYSSASANGFINGRLYNVTDAAVVPSSTMLCLIVYGANVTGQLQTCQSLVLTVAAPKTIRLEALRDGATTWVASGINPNNTTLTYVRLS